MVSSSDSEPLPTDDPGTADPDGLDGLDERAAVANMSHDELDTALASLLSRHPDAPVATINEDGLFVDVPATFDIGDRGVFEARSALDLVVPVDRVAVIEAWERARRHGAARAVVRLSGEHAETVGLSFLDMRHHHGVYVGVFVPQEGTGKAVDVTPLPSLPVRVGKIRKDEIAVITDVDESASFLLGWKHDEMVGRRSLEFIHPEDQERAINNWMEMLDDPLTTRPVRLRHLRKDGSWVWLEITNHYAFTDDERHVLADIVDLTDEMAAQEALRAREQLLDRLAQSVPLGLFQVDPDRNIVYTNARLTRIVGIDRAVTFDELFANVVAEDRLMVRHALAMVLDQQRDCDVEACLDLGTGGGLRRCGVSIRALTDPDGSVTGAIASVVDVTESVRLRSELEERATFDPLTRCHNRASVMAELERHLQRTRPGDGTAVVFVDLDRFKPVNDRLGHAAGDQLLRIVAERLQRVVRANDVVGRFGGDEFLVVCPGVNDEDEALVIAGRMAEALHRDAVLATETVDVRASVGFAWTDEPGLDAGVVVARADTAMYESKRQGAGRPVQYGATLHPVLPKGLEDERWLRAALADQHLEVHYQPIVALATGAVVGYEALLRAPRDGRLVAAGEFIELAEQTGLIHDIGDYVREETCAQAAALGAEADGLHWAINVSPLEIAAPGLAESFERVLGHHGIDPARVIVEVTEHSSLGDSSNARTTVHELHELGVTLALDDFGTGFSSLALLRTLPISIIKIDRSFTNEITEDVRSRRLVESLADLAQRLELQVVIEGVETAAQRALLMQMGATTAQGWLFAPAKSPRELFGDRARLTA